MLTWRIWWASINASKWQMGFNSAFKGLMWIVQNTPSVKIRLSKVAAVPVWRFTAAQILVGSRYVSDQSVHKETRNRMLFAWNECSLHILITSVMHVLHLASSPCGRKTKTFYSDDWNSACFSSMWIKWNMALLISGCAMERQLSLLNLLKPTGHVMHQQFNVQLYALPTLYLCVLYLSENKWQLLPHTK